MTEKNFPYNHILCFFILFTSKIYGGNSLKEHQSERWFTKFYTGNFGSDDVHLSARPRWLNKGTNWSKSTFNHSWLRGDTEHLSCNFSCISEETRIYHQDQYIFLTNSKKAILQIKSITPKKMTLWNNS